MKTTVPSSKEFAQLLKASHRAIRFSSVMCFSSATLVGAILAGSLMSLRAVWLLLFSVFMTAFGFAVNDLSDIELDRASNVLRNPVSTGELSLKKCIVLSLSLLIVSLVALLFLSLWNQLLGLVVGFIYFTYSWTIRAKARPVLDITYHGLCLAILATMGYIEFRSFDVNCFLFASLVFLLSVVSQILQEVRDYETDREAITTTVTLLGKSASLILSLAFLVISSAIFLLLLFYAVFPLTILLLFPLAYFIVTPILRALHSKDNEERVQKEIGEKRLILIGASIVILVLGKI